MKTVEQQFENLRDSLVDVQKFIRNQDYTAACFLLGQLYIECNENIRYFSNNQEDCDKDEDNQLDDLIEGRKFTGKEILYLMKLILNSRTYC